MHFFFGTPCTFVPISLTIPVPAFSTNTPARLASGPTFGPILLPATPPRLIYSKYRRIIVRLSSYPSLGQLSSILFPTSFNPWTKCRRFSFISQQPIKRIYKLLSTAENWDQHANSEWKPAQVQFKEGEIFANQNEVSDIYNRDKLKLCLWTNKLLLKDNLNETKFNFVG